MSPLILILLACAPKTSPYQCSEACLDMEAGLSASLESMGHPVESAQWQAMCREAPVDASCEECFQHIQQAWFAPLGLGWDCGCGLDSQGVAECQQEPDPDSSAVGVALDSCLAICEDQSLP
jgi:hypothetical protein